MGLSSRSYGRYESYLWMRAILPRLAGGGTRQRAWGRKGVQLRL